MMRFKIVHVACILQLLMAAALIGCGQARAPSPASDARVAADVTPAEGEETQVEEDIEPVLLDADSSLIFLKPVVQFSCASHSTPAEDALEASLQGKDDTAR